MIEIPLTHGKVALIDDEDYDIVSPYKWYWIKAKMQFGYAVSGSHPNKICMHNLIMNPSKGFEIDHRDGNGCNNTRDNLRFATRSQQCANRRHYKGRLCPYKGVRELGVGRWQARIKMNGIDISLGCFSTPEEAALAYNFWAEQCFGEFACLNEVD